MNVHSLKLRVRFWMVRTCRSSLAKWRVGFIVAAAVVRKAACGLVVVLDAGSVDSHTAGAIVCRTGYSTFLGGYLRCGGGGIPGSFH